MGESIDMEQDEGEAKEEDEGEKEMEGLQLSIYSIPGLTTKKSIKLWGTLGDIQNLH